MHPQQKGEEDWVRVKKKSKHGGSREGNINFSSAELCVLSCQHPCA